MIVVNLTEKMILNGAEQKNRVRQPSKSLDKVFVVFVVCLFAFSVPCKSENKCLLNLSTNSWDESTSYKKFFSTCY